MGKKVNFSIIIFITCLIFVNFDIFNHIEYVKNLVGKYIYPLDDTYIHLSISKNLALNNVWGITQHEFSSTSSSPLFTLIISFLILIIGNNELIPLYLNLIILNLFLLIIFLNFKTKPFHLIIILWGYLFLVLLKIQVISGMEHMLHIFLISTSWIYFCKWYDSNFTEKFSKDIFLITLPFLCLSRYESLFFVTLIAVLLFYKKLYKTSITVIILAYTPIIIFGIYAINQGGHFFPNSVLAKGNHSFTIFSIFKSLYSAFKYTITSNLYLWLLIFLISISFIYSYFDKKQIITSLKTIFDENLRTFLLILLLIFHLMFAKTGWLYRYDAYIIGLFFLTIALYLKKLKNYTNFSVLIMVLISGGILFLTSFDRYKNSNEVIRFANKNIYDQQIQMSTFLKKYFNKSTVVANDIGAITYYTNIKLYDLVGLGSTNILNYILKNNSQQYEKYINSLNYDIMIIYDSWFSNNNLANKKKVAILYLKDNHICGSNEVSFYLPLNSNKFNYTYKSLIEFKKQLPKDVELKIYLPNNK